MSKAFLFTMEHIDVTFFIDQQPSELKSILRALRSIIFQTVPYVDESIKYDIPFYNYYGRLCFLNPRNSTVLLGLCKGVLLANMHGLLEGTGKEVRHIRIKHLKDIDQTALQALLQEAVLLNEMLKSIKAI